MFLDEKQQGEAQTAERANRKLKLSEAIRIGKTLVRESSISHRFCALGCAWAGYNGHEMTTQDLTDLYRKYDSPWSARLAQSLGIDEGLAGKISGKHCNGMPALEIANWLEAKGL